MKIEVETDGPVLVVVLADCEVRNAVTAELKAELEAAIDRFAKDSALRSMLLTGKGVAFSAGGDIRTFGTAPTPNHSRERMVAAQRIAQKMADIEKPIIVAANGPAVGAGFGLAMLGDMLIAAQSAFFLPGFAGMGLVPDYGLSLSLAELVGAKRAADILFTDRRISSAQALELGIVSRVIPDAEFPDEARALARELAHGPTLALGMTKKLLRASRQMATAEFLALEGALQAVAMGTADHRAAVDAYFAKQRPVFTGS